jgi:ACS family glucarate transporter-like MFS transporter
VADVDVRQIGSPAAAATRVRLRVLVLVSLLSMITYLDRVCFGAAAGDMARDLGLSGVERMKWAFTAFALAYAIFEIPSGWLGDRIGARRTLMRIVIWWSGCTILTGLVGLRVAGVTLGGLGTLVALRFLFGAGEAGAYPNITRAVHQWFPVEERGVAQGCVWMAGRLMGGLTPLIWTLLVTGTVLTPGLVQWRGAFLLFGLLGFVWCAAAAAWLRDRPGEHPGVNAAEREWIEARGDGAPGHGSVPWGLFLTSGNLWMLCLMYFCMGCGWYFNITYLPSFLEDRFDVDPRSLLGAMYKGGPLWVGAAGCLAGGFLTDWLTRKLGNRRNGRRLIGSTGHALCVVCWLLAILAPNAHLFFLAVSGAALCNDLTMASAWATCQDIGRRHAAVTAAWMNTVGTVGAATCGWLTGTLLEWALAERAAELGTVVEALSDVDRKSALLSGYTTSFVFYAVMFGLSACCWLRINADQPIERDA